MGIKNLHKFLKKNCNNVYHEKHLSEYAFKKVAIDISLFMYKYKFVCGENWLCPLLNLIACLRKNEIHAIFIYDTGCPIEKKEEIEQRSSNRNKIIENIKNIEASLKKYYDTKEIDDVLINFNKKVEPEKVKRLLIKSNNNNVNISSIENEVQKMKSQITHPTRKDFELSKKLLDILYVPYFDSSEEAETLCSYLCIHNKVDAVLSEDTDILAYGAPIFLTKINVSTQTCVEINYAEILKTTNLSQSQFLDLCIMCGTDYNKNIPRIGPEKAYKLLKQHGNLENIQEKTNLDVSILKYPRVRELLNVDIRSNEKNIGDINYCGNPDFIKLQNFLFINNCKINLDNIKKSFAVKEIIFEED